MKNKQVNVWIRIAAYVVGTISALVMIACICGMVFLSLAGSKAEVLEWGYTQIAHNYMAYVLDEYFDNPEEVKETMSEVNMYYTIIKDIPVVDGTYVYNDKSTHIDSNVPEGRVPEYSYIYQGGESESHRYDIGHLLGALQEPYSQSGARSWRETAIQMVVLETNNDLFYLQTDVGYFLLNYVIVKEDGGYYDYMLETIDGERCYYNSYYDRKLRTDQYRSWTSIGWGDGHYAIDPYYMGGIFRVEEDSTIIQEKLISGRYECDGDKLRYRIEDNVYTVAAEYVPALNREDLFFEWNNKVTWLYGVEDSLILWEALATLFFLVSTGALVYTANGDKKELKLIHRCPLGLYLCGVAAIEIGLGALCVLVVNLWNYRNVNFSPNTAMFLLVQMVALMILLLLWGISNLATRIKTGTLYRYSEFYYIIRPIVKIRELVRENASLFWKVLIGTGVLAVLQLIAIISGMYKEELLLLLFALYKLVEIPVILFLVFQMMRLQKGSERIANGDLSEPIDTSKMFWEFKKHGDNINKVGDGISRAVEEQLKSERFKTELITNVSHDIKTPLTSIINYVDLMKKENITDPTLCEYVEVLDRQSGRLKKLIEDLMEASKASTGNLKVEPEACDIAMLLGQVVGEFEERFQQVGLETIILRPEDAVYIQVDGRHMWRILDNLMTNIYKYSLPYSRVYMELEQKDGRAVLCFKNISKTQLNISSDALMERFVRGDSSRNTEGSGLGLSIAQSLTELMQGTMKLDIDGDLFKVTLTFPI